MKKIEETEKSIGNMAIPGSIFPKMIAQMILNQNEIIDWIDKHDNRRGLIDRTKQIREPISEKEMEHLKNELMRCPRCLKPATGVHTCKPHPTYDGE